MTRKNRKTYLRYKITKQFEIDKWLKLLTSSVTREKQRDRQSWTYDFRS